MNILKKVISMASPVTEEKILQKGEQMMRNTFSEQKSYGLGLQEKFPGLTNECILTGSLPFRDDIPQKYHARLDAFRTRIQTIIFGTAKQIQDFRFKGSDVEVRTAGLSKFQERRYEQIRDAKKELYASYDAIREAIRYVTKFNNSLLTEIKMANGRRKTDLLLMNAITVYELTNIIIELIEHFRANGKETLQSINEQSMEEMRAHLKSDEDLWERAESNCDPVGESVKKSIIERGKIREIILKEWDKIWAQVETIESNVTSVRGYIPTLSIIRDNARGQINILESIGIVQIVQSNLDNFQELCGVADIELAPLSKEDVFGLVGRCETIDEPPPN